jgi:hypothetical protein
MIPVKLQELFHWHVPQHIRLKQLQIFFQQFHNLLAIVVDESTFFEEAEVPKAKDFGSSLFLLWDFYIFAWAYGKEEGKDGELWDRALLLRQLALGDFDDGTDGDGLLLFFFGVFVFEGAELSL